MAAFTAALAGHERLQDRIGYSKEILARVRDELAKYAAGRRGDICVFAAGSLGRFETGRTSDLDVFFLRDGDRDPGRKITRLLEIETISDVMKANDGLNLAPFSGDGRYLKIHEVSDLIATTGDARDDSENLFTARMLLLLESQPLSNDDVYNSAIQRVLANYFRDGRGKRDFIPLFLLNDVLRYWRTLCLNYEQARAEPGKPWWKRNLNLKFSRKLTVFSTVLAIIARNMALPEDFAIIAGKVPLERLAFALDTMGDDALLAPFRAALDDYEDFLAAKSHSELEVKDEERNAAFRERVQRFDDFFHRALGSGNLNRDLVRYVLI